MIHLDGQGWDILIDPDNGSLFKRCRYNEHQVFRDALNRDSAAFPQYDSACFPLLPFSNRIRNGQFKFQGQSVQLPINAPGQKHVLHGYGWITPWEIAEQKSDSCHLRQIYTPNDNDGSWPWPYEAHQSIRVENNCLRLELSLKNTGTTPMPAGLGFHPYFPDLEHAQLTFPSSGVWHSDQDVIPTTFGGLTPEFDLSKPTPLKSFQLDHCYFDVGQANISWDNNPTKIIIKSSDNLTRAAVYTAHADNAFCFEPVTHTHNAINMASPLSEGLTILAASEAVHIWCEFFIS